ncbi:serine/threonine-protein phosphatase PGAM5, mitochondrial isoform X3 [Leucoraja erinacea]|uniref:serine/threonine-protein phosphatase PGAM5, mitochondrial isoform X3 n=1 Tax=Leucoraja erinaceus TaxID=7782 RepID=UPI002454740B|nr:serine/threonine-protein phosphatase PGAM5, mitochondrial isoform X3 [Leucoraja erinacea]
MEASTQRPRAGATGPAGTTTGTSVSQSLSLNPTRRVKRCLRTTLLNSTTTKSKPRGTSSSSVIPSREQAELTGQRLASLGLNYDILIHSSMTRAKETATIIRKYLPGLEMMSCDLLREGAPIEPDPPVSHWKPEAMQYHEDGARIEAAFRRYIHRADLKQQNDSYEVIVCHANVIRYFVCRALQFPPEGWLRMCLNNGSITWLTIRPNGRVALRTLGDTGFMPPDKLTR